MSDSIFLTAIIGPLYMVLGLSVLLYSNTWHKAAEEWLKKPSLLMGTMLLSLIFGLTVIVMHNRWEWNTYLIVTLTGWSAFLKGACYFLLPEKKWQKLIKSMNKTSYYHFIGMVILCLGIWLSYTIYVA